MRLRSLVVFSNLHFSSRSCHSQTPVNRTFYFSSFSAALLLSVLAVLFGIPIHSQSVVFAVHKPFPRYSLAYLMSFFVIIPTPFPFPLSLSKCLTNLPSSLLLLNFNISRRLSASWSVSGIYKSFLFSFPIFHLLITLKHLLIKFSAFGHLQETFGTILRLRSLRVVANPHSLHSFRSQTSTNQRLVTFKLFRLPIDSFASGVYESFPTPFHVHPTLRTPANYLFSFSDL